MTAPATTEERVIPLPQVHQERANVPHITQWMGPWCIEDDAGEGLLRVIEGMDLRSHLAARPPAGPQAGVPVEHQDHIVLLSMHSMAAMVVMEQSRRVVTVAHGYAYEVIDGVAYAGVQGVIMRHESSMEESTSTTMLRRTMRHMLHNSDVKAVMLLVDSPGGTVAGTGDLAEDIAALAAVKPVHAHVENIGASGAAYLFTQATRVSASPTAWVGSLGVYWIIADYTGFAAQKGIKVHKVASGSFKGMGAPGTEITAEHLEEAKRVVMTMHEQFMGAVMRGRKMSRAAVNAIADGRVFSAPDGKAAGLIDSVESIDVAIGLARKAAGGSGVRASVEVKAEGTIEAQVNDTTNGGAAAADSLSNPHSEETIMSDTKETPRGATIAELKAALPKATSEFLVKCLESGRTLEQAKQDYIKSADERLEALATRKPGNQPVNAGPAPASGTSNSDSTLSFTGDARARAEELTAEKVKGGMKPHEAWAAVMRENPALQEALVEQHNATHQVDPRRRR